MTKLPSSVMLLTTFAAAAACAAGGALTPSCGSITLAPASLPSGMAGHAYQDTVTASGGTPPYRFAVTAGAPPDGLSLSPDGIIAGTAKRRAGYAFTITATDGEGCAGSRAFDVYICWQMDVVPSTLPPGVLGESYAQTLTAMGVSSPTMLAVGGTLPPGLQLQWIGGPSSRLFGTLAAPGGYAFELTGGDQGCSFQRDYVLHVTGGSDAITIAAAPREVADGSRR